MCIFAVSKSTYRHTGRFILGRTEEAKRLSQEIGEMKQEMKEKMDRILALLEKR